MSQVKVLSSRDLADNPKRWVSDTFIIGGIFMRKRGSLPQIKLSDSQREKLREEIGAFYLDVRGEEIGMIEQIQLMDLFEEKLAPVIYNRALEDAKRWFGQVMENAESDFYGLYKDEG